MAFWHDFSATAAAARNMQEPFSGNGVILPYPVGIVPRVRPILKYQTPFPGFSHYFENARSSLLPREPVHPLLTENVSASAHILPAGVATSPTGLFRGKVFEQSRS